MRVRRALAVLALGVPHADCILPKTLSGAGSELAPTEDGSYRGNNPALARCARIHDHAVDDMASMGHDDSREEPNAQYRGDKFLVAKDEAHKPYFLFVNVGHACLACWNPYYRAFRKSWAWPDYYRA